MSNNRLKLTNEDLSDVFKFKNYLNLPNKKVYCKIYGKVYTNKEGEWLFDNKEELIESFMTSPIFEPLWNKLIDIAKEKYAHLFTMNNRTIENKKWFKDDTYLNIHNKLENCINYYKEVLINRMIRTRVIIFHNGY